MSNPHNPFRINVGFIVHEEIGYHHDFPLVFDEAVLGEDLVLTNFTGTLEIGRTSQGLIATGKFEGKTTLECVRCLNDFTHTLNWEITDQNHIMICFLGPEDEYQNHIEKQLKQAGLFATKRTYNKKSNKTYTLYKTKTGFVV